MHLPDVISDTVAEDRLRALGAYPRTWETLPASPYVQPSDVGRPGPWTGWVLPDGSLFGFWLTDMLLSRDVLAWCLEYPETLVVQKEAPDAAE